MRESEKIRFYSALENDVNLKREFIKQKNLWAVSSSIGTSTHASESNVNTFLYRFNTAKGLDKGHQRLRIKLNSYKVAAAVMFALLLGSVAYLLQQNAVDDQSAVFYTETYVPKGEKSELLLPDGTHLFINADSRVRIPSNFSATNRRLELNGEAYFSVVHDVENPFLVETESITIEVLGTSFDLSCYSDDELVTTTLDEGSVRFSGANNNTVNGRYLKPGQTAHYHKSSGLFKIHKTEEQNDASAWKDGKLKFKDLPFVALAKKIERLYDVEIEIDESLKYERYTGEINEETVWAVMNHFAIATPFNVETVGRKIIVTPKKNFK